MRSSDVGGAQDDPSRLVVQKVQIAEHLVEAEGQMAADVLKEAPLGPEVTESVSRGRRHAVACLVVHDVAGLRAAPTRMEGVDPVIPDIDDVAVERACKGDRTVPLNRDEMAAAFALLDRRGLSINRIAATLGTSDKAIVRWRAGQPAPARRVGAAA